MSCASWRDDRHVINPGATIPITFVSRGAFRAQVPELPYSNAATFPHPERIRVIAIPYGAEESWRQAMHELMHVHEARIGHRDEALRETLRAISGPTWDAISCGAQVPEASR
jgi:DNA topoisomerase VI subunit B